MAYSLYEKLTDYRYKDMTPFHMPGHMRNPDFASWGFPFEMDITEIDGFDNLHHARGILMESQERLSRLYGSRSSYYLVNGSTAGILASISACVQKNGHILMARNCHKSAFHAVYLRDLHSEYIMPEPAGRYRIHGDIRPEEVRRMLEICPKAEAVFITSPTYDGVVSDIGNIACAVHEKGLPLIVDEAHGAHLIFSGYFPSSAVQEGADLVIQSFHKTLPSLTQSAVLHVCSDRIDRNNLERFLGMYQTSSPSYILMAGMDRCVRFLEEEGEAAFALYTQRLHRAREALASNSILSLIEPQHCHAYDRSKILLSAPGKVGGPRLAGALRERFRIEVEMEAVGYVLALSSVGNRDKDFERLISAVKDLDAEWDPSGQDMFFESRRSVVPEAVMTIAQAMEGPAKEMPLSDSGGHISKEFVWIYPPGIPLIAPGERISSQVIGQLENARRSGLELQGLSDRSGLHIKVVG